MKSKSTAIVLAIFFSFWSWLYTYRRSSTKFWLIFGINIIIGIVMVISSIFFTCTLAKNITFSQGSVVSKVSSSDEKSINIIFIIWTLIIIFEVGVWLWSIIDNAVKSRAFYINYPWR